MTVNNTLYTRKAFCQKDQCNRCFESNVFIFWAQPIDLCNEQIAENNWENTDDANLKEKLNAGISVLSSFLPNGVSSLIGGLVTETDGKVKSGSALTHSINHKISDEFNEDVHKEWEQKFIDHIRGLTLNRNLELYVFATRSIGDEFGDTVGGDSQLLSFGFILVFIYISIMLGK